MTTNITFWRTTAERCAAVACADMSTAGVYGDGDGDGGGGGSECGADGANDDGGSAFGMCRF